VRLQIRSSPFSLTPALQARVQRRLQFALNRFQAGIGRVTVRLRDLNGPRGGLDKRCSIEARLLRRRKCVVEETCSDLYEAIDRAADRLGRVIARHRMEDLDRPQGERR
jgi:ribosomal subunit interface protein